MIVVRVLQFILIVFSLLIVVRLLTLAFVSQVARNRKSKDHLTEVPTDQLRDVTESAKNKQENL
jgi:hypothetical protein